MGIKSHRRRRNHLASLVLDPSSPAAISFRLCSSFSLASSSFRRKLIHSMRCGARGEEEKDQEHDKQPMPPHLPPAAAERNRSEDSPKQKGGGGGGSEKLSELLRLSEEEEEENEVKKKKKVAALEELKRVVKALQCDLDHDLDLLLWGAQEVRRLAKDDPQARTTLALLGAIPTLVRMLDSTHIPPQIASLYALLNLGIANHV